MKKFEDVDPVRSHIMSAIRSKDTKPEMAVRRLAHAMGYRFRLHAGGLPGRPDLAFPSRRKAIFVHGCFWHGHEACGKFRLPATRTEFWAEKIGRNRERDAGAIADLAERGWDSLVVWECETKDPAPLAARVRNFLGVSAAGAPDAANKVDFAGTSGRFATSTAMGRAPARIRKNPIHSQKDSSMPSKKRREAAAAKAAAARAAQKANPADGPGAASSGAAEGGEMRTAPTRRKGPSSRSKAKARKAASAEPAAGKAAPAEAAPVEAVASAAPKAEDSPKPPAKDRRKRVRPSRSKEAKAARARAAEEARAAEDAKAARQGDATEPAAAQAETGAKPDLSAGSTAAPRDRRKRVRPSRSNAAKAARARAAEEARAAQQGGAAGSDSPEKEAQPEAAEPAIAAAPTAASGDRRQRVRPSRSNAAKAERARAAEEAASRQAPRADGDVPETAAPAAAGERRQDVPAVAEMPIPRQFSVRTDLEGQTVTISRGQRRTTVPMSAYGSVAGALFVLAPDEGDVPPTSVIEISDSFTDKRAKLTAANLPFLFRALGDLLVGGAEAGAAGGVATPEAASELGAAEGTPPTEVQAFPAADVAPSTTEPAPQEAEDAAPPFNGLTPEQGAGALAEKEGRQRASRSRPPAMPDWFSSFEETIATDGGFELRRTSMVLDGTAKNTVVGAFGTAKGQVAWGYEVVADGKHVAWVIAQAPTTFILTGAPGQEWSKHNKVLGVVARITAMVMPRLRDAA